MRVHKYRAKNSIHSSKPRRVGSLWCIFCHLVLFLLIAALIVEGYIGVTAVKNSLIASAVLTNVRESLDDAETQLLALLALVHGNVLNVTDTAETAEELALDEDGANAYDRIGRLVDEHDRVVGVRRGAHSIEANGPCLKAWV